MSIHLTPRLLAVAECVPMGARVIDVGTDHAMVPVWLAQEVIAKHIWAADLREGPLRNASALIERTNTNTRIELRLTNGLQGFGPEDGDTIIMAGMGGETMISILSEASKWLQQGGLLILQPQTKQAELRRWLSENRFSIQREMLVEDHGRIYSYMTVVPGEPATYTTAELYTGLFTQISGDKLFCTYLDQLLHRVSSAAPYDADAQALLYGLQVLKERTNNNDNCG